MAGGGAGRGALAAPDRYHTVLDFPDERRKPDMKLRKAAAGSWRMFFAMGKTPASLRKKSQLGELFNIDECPAGGRAETVTLRSAKSEESLSSQTSGAGLHKLHRLRRPRSSSDAFPLAAESTLLPGLKSCRSCESLESEGRDSVYTVPDFNRRTSMWMEDDEMDFSPPFLEAGSLDFDPLSFQCSPPRRSLVEDSDSSPESLLERRAASMRKVPDEICQMSTPLGNPSRSAPAHGSEVASPLRERVPKSFSFTRKVARALSPRGSRSPPMDISEPISITIPAKVLEMLGSKAGDGQGPGTPTSSAHGPQSSQAPPQMISMLLKSCDIQLSESCQQEIHRKLSLGETKVRGQPAEHTSSTVEPSKTPEADQHKVSILRHVPPPPPPKNPARLMALALAESAQRALNAPHPVQKEQAAPLASQFRRSVSLECGETLPPGSLYSAVRPQPGGGKTGGAVPFQRQQSESGLRLSSHQREKRHPQVSGPMQSQTSASHSRKLACEAPAGGRNLDGMSANGVPHTERLPAHQGRSPVSSAPLPGLLQSKGLDSFHTSSNMAPTRTSENPSRNPTMPAGRGTAHNPMAPTKSPPHFYHAKTSSLPSSSANLPFRAMTASRPRAPYRPAEPAGKILHQSPAARGDGTPVKPTELVWTGPTTRMPGLPNPNFPFLAEVRQPLKHRNSFPAYGKGTMPPHPAPPQEESPPGKQENLYYEIISDSPVYLQNPRSAPTLWGSPHRFSGFPPQQGRPGPEYLTAVNASYGVIDQPWREPVFPIGPPFSAPPHDFNVPYPAHFPRQSYPPYKSQPSWQQAAGRPTMSRMEVPPDPEALAYQRLAAAPAGTPPPPSTGQLQPFFENGKVCYKYVTSNSCAVPEVRVGAPSGGLPSVASACAPLPEVHEAEEIPEPIYVNFPFFSKMAGDSGKLEIQQQQQVPKVAAAQEITKRPSPQPEQEKVEQGQTSPAHQKLPTDSRIQAAQLVQSYYDNMVTSKSREPGRPEIAHTKSRSDPGLESHQRPFMPPHPRRSAGASCESPVANDPHLQLSERTALPQKLHLNQATQDQFIDFGRPRWPYGAPAPHSAAMWQESNRRMPSPGLYKQMYDVLPCGNTILKFYRPPPAYWGPSGGHPLSASYSSIIPNMDYDVPIITYDPHFENLATRPGALPEDQASQLDTRSGDMAGKALQGGQDLECHPENYPVLGSPCVPYSYQVYGNQASTVTASGAHYGNVDRKEDGVSPGFPSGIPAGSSPLRQGPCLAPSWTRSYC